MHLVIKKPVSYEQMIIQQMGLFLGSDQFLRSLKLLVTHLSLPTCRESSPSIDCLTLVTTKLCPSSSRGDSAQFPADLTTQPILHPTEKVFSQLQLTKHVNLFKYSCILFQLIANPLHIWTPTSNTLQITFSHSVQIFKFVKMHSN